MSITGLPCGPGLCPERTISGNIYLNYNNDLYYITGNNTISSLVYVSNSTNINLYNGYYNIFNYYTNALLSISSILFTSTTNYNSCLNGMQSLNNISYPNGATVYNNIYIPQYTYSIDPINSFDASGNYTSYITTTSSYKTASNVSSVSGVIYNDLSGLYFGLNILNNYQDLYNSSYSTYISVLNQLQLITNNMLTISNNIFLNQNTLYPVNTPIYNSLNSILNDKQNQLNSLSSFINYNSNQIITISSYINNFYYNQSYINNLLSYSINTISANIISVNNNLTYSINTNTNNINSVQTQLNNNTQILQNQINNVYTASGFIASNNILQSQINTLSGFLYNVANNDTFNNLYATSYNDKASVASFTFTNGIPYLYNDFYNLKFQTDGNLVIYTNSNNSVVFNTLGTNNNMASNTTNITNNTNSINSIQSQLNNLYTISGFTNNNNIIQTQLNTLSSVINIVASNNTFSNLNVSTINSISGIALNINSTGKPLFINSYNSDINLTSNTGAVNIGSQLGDTNFYSSQNVNFNNIIDVDFNNNGNVNISPAGSINLTKAIFCNNSLTLPNNSNSSTNKLFLAGNDLNHSIYSTGSGGNSMYFNEFNEFIFYSTQRNANSLTIDNVGNVVTSGNINCGNITCTVGDNLLVDNIAGITNVYGYRYLQLYDMINIYDGMVIGYGSSSPHRLPINTIDVNGSIGATYYYNNIGKSSDTAQWFGFNNSSLGGIQMTYYNYWLILQGDRNLVLYDKSSGSQVAVWNSGTSVSDRNFKKNIVNTSISGIHSIKKINIVDYQYIESFEPDNKIRVGVIAQDLLHIVPEAVKWFDNPNYSISGTISGSISGSIYTDQLPGNYVVNLDRIVPYLIKGMQEQQVIIDSLVNRISILENKIL